MNDRIDAAARFDGRRIDMESAVLGARFCDGGHHVNGEDSAPIRLDDRIATVEEAAGWTFYAQLALAAVTVGCTAFALIKFFLS